MMRTRTYFLEGLLGLHAQKDRDARRRLFRQSMASLGIADSLAGPSPLEGLRPELLARNVRVALADGLFEDLGWLAPAPAAVAVYEIAGALPLGPERRDLGRRIVHHLYDGNAATFVALATRMAASSAKALSGLGVRSRVALTLSLPARADVAVGPLALALVSRREAAREWIGAASTRSLPERRLAARLLEHAAREAAQRTLQGDDQSLFLFRGTSSFPRSTRIPHSLDRRSILSSRRDESARSFRGSDVVTSAWHVLLADREGLVWRHVAVARGLLSAAFPAAEEEILGLLSPELSPTEWRRGATSLAARIAVAPGDALPRALELLSGPLAARDPGIATAMMWGLAPAADAEPEAATELVNALAAAHPIGIAESLMDLVAEVGDFGRSALDACSQALNQSLAAPEDDEGLTCLARAVLRDLASGGAEGGELRNAVRRALDAFVETGSREAFTRGQEALALAEESVTALEALDVGDEPTPTAKLSRRTSIAILRDLDASLLESGVLMNLLVLDRRTSEDSAGLSLDLDERLVTWLIKGEGGDHADEPARHQTLHQRQLRALLHIVDGDAIEVEQSDRRARLRGLWLTTCDVMLTRLLRERNSPHRRAIAAILARTYDALVRDAAADPADVAVHAAMKIEASGDLEILAEASMHPDTRQILAGFARFASALRGASDPEAGLEALSSFVEDIPAGASQRIDVMRGSLARLHRLLDAIAGAPSLRSLVADERGDTTLSSLEDTIAKLTQIAAGASQRCGDPASAPMPLEAPARPLAAAVAQVADSEPDALGEPDALRELEPSIQEFVDRARAEIPAAIADLLALVLPRLTTLSIDRATPSSMPSSNDMPLPAWIPTRRTIGGFYVLQKLGGGALGTVFVVTRAEERHKASADRFALKVPEYSATAARSVSEAEFMKLFRDEAGALLSVPEHPNLARFVTFDAGAKPKPILVMELVLGAPCEKLIASKKLTMAEAVRLLDGILAGLEAMHDVGVGHLDVKPSNVIMRDGKHPVLVDFGLAGRHIRPGCASGCYGAPEVWGVVPADAKPTPMTADVYSFGCLAYEVLTGDTLFDGPNEVALISAHLTHDGMPLGVKRMATDVDREALGMFLFHCLRHNPSDRMTVAALRGELRRAGRRVKAGMRVGW